MIVARGREAAGLLRTLIDDSKNICRQTTPCHLSPRPRPPRPARSSGVSSAPRISPRRQNLSPTHRCRARNELVWKCLQKALVGAYCYSAIVKSSRTSLRALTHRWRCCRPWCRDCSKSLKARGEKATQIIREHFKMICIRILPRLMLYCHIFERPNCRLNE